MAANDVAVGAASPHHSGFGHAPSMKMDFPDKELEQLLLPHMNTLTKAQESFTDYKMAVKLLAYSRVCVELKRLLPSNKRDDCLHVLKRLLEEFSDEETIQATRRVLHSLQYNKTELRASRLGPILKTLGHEAEEVAAEPQEVFQQYHGESRSVFGRQLYLSD